MWEICYPETLQTLNWENVDINAMHVRKQSDRLYRFYRYSAVYTSRKKMRYANGSDPIYYELQLWFKCLNYLKHTKEISLTSWLPFAAILDSQFQFYGYDALWLAADVNFKTMQSLDWCKSLKIELKDWWFFSVKKIWCSPLFENSKFHLRTCARRVQMICWVFPVNWRLFPTKTRVDVLFAGSSRANGANNNF